MSKRPRREHRYRISGVVDAIDVIGTQPGRTRSSKHAEPDSGASERIEVDPHATSGFNPICCQGGNRTTKAVHYTMDRANAFQTANKLAELYQDGVKRIIESLVHREACVRTLTPVFRSVSAS